VGAIALGVGCAAGCRRESRRNVHGLLLGLAGGVFFGVSDVSIKAVAGGSHGMLGLVGPSTFLGILAAVGAFFLTAKSLQIGNAVGVIAATTSAATAVGIAGGIVLFGDPLGSDPAMIVGRLLAFILVVFAVALVPAPIRAHEAAQGKA
jgi:hypothetical protein